MENLIDWSKWLCRASKSKVLVTKPKVASEAINGLGATALSYLRETHRSATYNRQKEYTNKFINKGKELELDGLKLLSLVQGVHIKKNDIRVNSEYFTGEADTAVYVIDGQKKIFDIKCSWDLWSYPYKGETLNPDYEWQNLVYCDLYDADSCSTVYTLLNSPVRNIIYEKNSVWRTLGEPDESSPLWELCLEKWIEIEKNMIFDYRQFKKDNPYYDLDCKEWTFDIPEQDRVMVFKTERDDTKIALLKEKVISARTYLQTL